MEVKLTPLVLAIAAVSYQPISLAATMDDLRINGFLSAGVAVTDNDKLSVGSIDEDASFKEDTTLGIQISAPISDRFSLTGQLVAKGNENYEVDASWAYASFEATDELTLRAGRLRVPFYYYSDSLDVGYGYHWIRPPEETYAAGFSNIDALDALYTTNIGDVETSFQVYYGRYEDDTLSLTNFGGAVGTFTLDTLTARLSYHQVDVDTPTGLPTGPQTAGFITGSLVYDDSTNFVIIETTKLDVESVFANTSTFLASYARTLNDQFTVHISYGDRDTNEKLIPNNSGQRSYIGGVRYDIENNVALKFEAQHTETRVAGPDEDGMIYSTAVDLVF